MTVPQDTKTLDDATAPGVLAGVLQAAGIRDSHPELVRAGSNVIFRLRDRPIIVRISRRMGAEDSVRREVQVARWLADQGIPAVRPLPLEQPVVVDGWAAVLWESVNDRASYGSVLDLADLLRSLHQLAPPPFELPALDPPNRLLRRIETEPELSDADRMYLREQATSLAGSYQDLRFVLPGGVIHGDANVGNVLRTQTGCAVLSDLDGLSIGPREWDLLLTAMYYERYGWHTAAEYRSFADRYGFDMLSWQGYQVLRDLRELSMVVWVAGGISSSQLKRDEFSRRMSSLRTGTGFDQWRPF